MIGGIVVMTIVVLVFVVIGISTWNSKETAGFFNVIDPPKIPKANIKKYNHSVAVIWFVFSGLLGLLGVPPLIFMEQNSPYSLIPLFGIVFLIIGIIIAYLKVENYFSKEIE